MLDSRRNKNLKNKDSKVSVKLTKINNILREIEETLSVNKLWVRVTANRIQNSNSRKAKKAQKNL